MITVDKRKEYLLRNLITWPIIIMMILFLKVRNLYKCGYSEP